MERDGKTYCDKHPNVESALRCSRCEAYICPKCAVLTPVGYRCRSCGLEKSATQTLGSARLILGSLLGVVLGFLGTLLAQSIYLGFFVLFLAVAAGTVTGQILSRAIGRKRSAIVGGAAAVGFIGGLAFPAIQHVASGGNPESIVARIGGLWTIVFAIIAAAVAWVQVK